MRLFGQRRAAKKLLYIGAALLVIAYVSTAHAAEWKCGLVSVELKKNMVHDYTLTVDGPLQVNPLNVKITERKGIIYINGKECSLVEHKEDE